MLDAVDDSTRILFLTNPQNPTGTNIARDEFQALTDNISDDVLVVMDEAYYEYCPPEDRLESAGYLG